MCPVQKEASGADSQISLNGIKQVTKYGSNLREMIMMEIGNTIKFFGNLNMIRNRHKEETPMNFLTNAGYKILYEAGQTKINSEMIANVLSLN